MSAENAHLTTCQGPRKSVDQNESSLSKMPEKDPENVHQEKIEVGPSESGRVSLLPKEEPDIKSCKSDSPVKQGNIFLDSSEQRQSQKMAENACKLRPRQNPDTSVQDFPPDQGVTPINEPEKPSEDGYNWRKYGQKLVRGNEFTRSYYKCTHPNCLAKKQVERSRDGNITSIHYITKHEHPKPLKSPQIGPELRVPSEMKRPDIPTGTPHQAEGEKFTALGQACQSIEPSESLISAAGGSAQDTGLNPLISGGEGDNNGGRKSKRRKKQVPRSADMTPPMKSNSEPRHIVQTTSEVDIVNDGFRWRKYGQKFVKGNPNPRSYYRCSSTGCPAKKHVERASHDPKSVITAYEGQHDHDMPHSRTVLQTSAGTDSNTTRESTSESGEIKHDVHIGPN
ncbi:unnamed protein product [Withania somnifera]